MTAPQPGFAEPVYDAQRVFRTALAAMSYPGRIERLDAPATVPPPFSRASLALALALIDEAAPLWCNTAHAAGIEHLRFHCGARIVDEPAQAAFGLGHARECPLPDQWARGTTAEPHRSATLILEVDSLDAGERYQLSGPGIAQQEWLTCRGLPSAWVAARATSTFPCGVDVFLTSEDRVVALPRTTRIEA